MVWLAATTLATDPQARKAALDPKGAARGNYGAKYQRAQKVIDPFDIAQYQKSAKAAKAGEKVGEAGAAAQGAFDRLSPVDIAAPERTFRDLQQELSGYDNALTGGQGDISSSRAGLGTASSDISRMRALSQQGLGDFASQELAAQRLRTGAELEGARGESALQAARQRSALASSGGLSGGARERLGASSSRQALLAQQQTRRAGGIGEADILSRARQQQLGLAGQLPGAEVGLAGAYRGLGEFGANQEMNQRQLQLNNAMQRQGARQFDTNAVLDRNKALQTATGEREKLGAQIELAPLLAKAQIGASAGKKG